MKNIVLVRIDDRLVHGQVMTSWLNYTGANKIMVIDDEVAEDKFLKSVLKTVVPSNVKLACFNVENGVVKLMKGFDVQDKVIVLVKFPKTLHRLMEKGVVFQNINIGGMGVSGTRTKFYKNISASNEEKIMLKELIEKGSSIKVQIIAEDSPTDVSSLL